MAQLEVASTAGTWVAAFLALLALGVFVGPFFIWRASQTERHQALDKLEAGEAESGGFVSKGLQVSPSIRLFRRIRVPELCKEPQLPGQKLVWNGETRLVSSSSVGWVQFCVLIKAHGIDMSLGGHLEIDTQRTWLPLYRNWVLVFGIARRFAMRSDEGKLRPSLRGRAKSVQGMPGLEGRRGPTATGIFKKKGSHWAFKTPRRGDWVTDESGDEIAPLFGTSGTLWTMRNASDNSRHKVYYQHHTAVESGSPVSDMLSIQTLFWLAVGCLPFENGDLYSLENCILYQEAEKSTGRRKYEFITSDMTNRTHFEEEDSDGEDSDDEDSYNEWSTSMKDLHRPSSYVVYAMPKHQDRYLGPRHPRVLRFSVVKETAKELAQVASSLEQSDQRGNVYSLEEIDIPDDIAKQLKDCLGDTYHPKSSNFVRLGMARKRIGHGEGMHLFLERASSQLLAKGLLDLALSPEGYIVGFARDSWCRAMLCSSAQLLPHLLTRICNDIDHLQVPESSKKDFIDISDKLLVMCLNYKPTRSFYQTIHNLDVIIRELLPLNPKAMAAVGVVTITSVEFRDFLTSVVRMIPDSTGKSVTLDLGPASTLNIPSVMGVIQKYPVDITHIFPGENVSIEAVEIRFHHLIFAALKACLRSTVLETSLDSTPLFEAFMQMNEVVYMG